MRPIVKLLLIVALCCGCAASGGGTSGTGLDYDDQCPADRPGCCPQENNCVAAERLTDQSSS